VILTDDQLILKNSIYTFWHKEYLYKDIAKIEIKPSRNIYMRVTTKKRKKFAWDYVIDLVAPENINELIELIEAKGIVVDSTGLNLNVRYPAKNLNKKISVGDDHCENNSKIFRQSFWNTALVKTNLSLTMIITTSLAPVIFLVTDSIWWCLIFVLLGYSLFPIYFFHYFYVILSPEKLIIQNGRYSSSRQEYDFHDIVKVRITQDRNIYMQVFMCVQKDIPRRYCIDLVAVKDYKFLVDMIKAKGG